MIQAGSGTAPISVTPSPVEDLKADDDRYYKLFRPITVGAKTFDRLLIDSSELSGTVYFNLVSRFRKERSDIYRTSINKLMEETFLSYVIAELNPPMIVEDVQKIGFADLPLLFMSLQGFLFGARTEKTAPE